MKRRSLIDFYLPWPPGHHERQAEAGTQAIAAPPAEAIDQCSRNGMAPSLPAYEVEHRGECAVIWLPRGRQKSRRRR